MPESSKPQIAETIQPPRNRLWLHWATWLILVLIVFSPVFIVIGINVYNRQKADRELKEAIAETDRLDPGLAAEDIEKRRIPPPAEENAAIHVLAAEALLPKNWNNVADKVSGLTETPPQVQIDPGAVEPLRVMLAPLLPALPVAQKTLPLKNGFYEIAWNPEAFGTRLPHLQKVRDVASFLNYLAILQNHDAKYDNAWQSSLTILAVGRSLGDEPLIISQLVRMNIRNLAICSLEQCLAQGHVTDPLLAEAQRQIALEAIDPILYYAIHGERASYHRIFESLEMGNVSGQMARDLQNPSFFIWMERFLAGNTYKGDDAWALRYMNDAVAASKLPTNQQRTAFAGLESRANQAPRFARMVLIGLSGPAHAILHKIAKLQCTHTAIAVERFRLANNRWPESLDEVVAAKLLDKIPEDPYDGKPLRYRKTTDGVVVYSIGRDGTYAGDALDAGRPYNSSVIRYEFRLWDEAHRRQPPRPKVEDKKDGGSR